MTRTLLGALLGPLLAPIDALACGGFFCSTAQPVDQSAEEVLFAVNDDDTVTMHVKIAYEGDAEDFAWIVPVAGEPQLEIGTDALFPVLSSLRARFNLDRRFGDCELPSFSATSADSTPGGGGGVSITSRGVVGPYETVVLQAADSEVLIDWLQGEGFDLPDAIEPALAPYVADGQHFVALKLQKDKDVGDLEPLAMTWRGDQLSIPIQLTAVAATPDMGLRVYVLGDHRAVPESYLHVRINELAVDWWTGGGNIADVISRAADEAGGHGFFTDYAGSRTQLLGQLHRPAWDPSVDDIAAAESVVDVLATVLSYDLPLDDATMGVLSDHLGLPESGGSGLALTELFRCLQPYGGYYYTTGYVDPEECYADELDEITFDAVALAADIEAVVLEPRRRTEALLSAHPKITRLTSSVSPVEMTIDPTFVFNPSMPDVPVDRVAVETFHCDDGVYESVFEAPRSLALSDGRIVALPSVSELLERGLSEIEWLEDRGLTEPATVIIERTGPDGPPEVIQDNTLLLAEQLQTLFGGGCGGCSGVARPGAAGLLGLLGLLVVRRRR